MAMKILHIFDFDDTLVSSDSKVVIKDRFGREKSLTSEEYASYTKKPGDQEDFSDFDKYPKNPVIIEPVFAELRTSIALDGKESVVILTARSSPGPVKAFLLANEIPSIHVEAVGSANPMAKVSYIMKKLKENPEIEEVRVFEDNVRNIRTIKRVIGDKDSGVRLKTNRVANGNLVEVFQK